ncbi:hypothetical protein Glove_363g34 [Diversispora epigaea]|uniref:Transmembrane protein 135 N-terminal domain-containing protein n=1 Tax=Diversispora epigaea TaxID=1348612 RepID=A0A397HD56_9GLOM|nr:hypothetical protein Glove_363g34 [Diversispora epigaea]
MTELVGNTSSKQRRKFLFFLSFILSKKDYSNVTKILSPFINKFGLEFPSNEEFKSTCNSQTHKHETASGAIRCLHDECLPKTSRTGITDFIKVYAIINLVEIIKQLPTLSKNKKSFLKIIDSLFKTSSFRFALSISSFAVVYQTLLRFFTRKFDPLLGPHSRMNIICSPLVPPFLAGLFAGPTLLIDNIQSRRIDISTYALCKSLQFIYSALRDNRIIPIMPWWWGAWLSFPISFSQMVYCYLIHPDIFPSSFGQFITNRSSTYVQRRPSYFPDTIPWPKGREIVDRIAILASLHYPEFYSPKLHGRDPALPKVLKPIQPILEIAHPAHNKMMCATLHPEDPSCFITYLKFIAKEGVAALKFMSIGHAIFLATRWKYYLSRPKEANYVIPEIFKGATFITMSIATAWGLICGFQNLFPNKFMSISRIYLNGFIGGLWILLLDPVRRTEIGMTSFRFLLETSWKLLVKKGKVKSIKNGEVICFSFAMACIMTIYKTQPKSISSPYVRNTIEKLMGDS